MQATKVKHGTGPLPAFDTDAPLAQRMTDAEKNKRDAFLLLDNMNDYGMSKSGLIDELTFNFGYTPDEAKNIYAEWYKAVT